MRPRVQPGEGTCEKPRVAGGDCFSVYDCAQNHRCEGAVYPAQPGTCVLLKSTGEACTDTEQCAAGTWCDGTCKPQKPLGAACAESEECGWKLHCSANTCQLKMCEDVTP